MDLFSFSYILYIPLLNFKIIYISVYNEKLKVYVLYVYVCVYIHIYN